MLSRFALPTVCALSLVAGSASAQSPTDVYRAESFPAPPIDHQTQNDSLAFRSDPGDRMTVSVSLGSRGPFQFLVDTGSERTIISRQLANRLGLERGRGVRIHSIVGVGLVDTALIPRLQMSRKEVRAIDAPMLEAGNIGADGILGIDSLRAQRILFDFKANRMSVTPSSERAESLGDGTIVVRARSRRGRLILTDARVGNQAVAVVLDTGSQVTIGNMALRRRLIRSGMLGEAETVTLQSVTGATLQGEYMHLEQLEIGGAILMNLAIVFVDAHSFKPLGLDHRPALLLGMNAMRAFDRVSIDFTKKKLRVLMPSASRADGIELAAR